MGNQSTGGATAPRIPPTMNRDAIELHLPNAKNCIQSALYQLQKGNSALAAEFLESAKRSIDKANSSPKKIRKYTEVMPH